MTKTYLDKKQGSRGGMLHHFSRQPRPAFLYFLVSYNFACTIDFFNIKNNVFNSTGAKEWAIYTLASGSRNENDKLFVYKRIENILFLE